MSKKNSTVSKQPSIQQKYRKLQTRPSISGHQQFKKLQAKYASMQKLKACNRTFNKSLFSKLAKRIEERAISFYNFGLREHQKQNHRDVFIDVFEVNNRDLKGSMTIGELWDNKNSIAYLKQNKMFFNKDILFDELKSLKKNLKQKKKIEKSTMPPLFNPQIKSSKNFSLELKEKNPTKNCINIREKIQELLQNKHQNIIYRLQSDRKRIEGLSDKFTEKMMMLM